MTHDQQLDTDSLWRLEPQPLLLRRLAQGTMGMTPYAHNPHRVMLGISDDDLRSQTYSLMSREGFEVDFSEDGDHLLQMIGDAILQLDGCSRPKLIVADSGLAGCNGKGLLRALKDLDWQTSLILLSDGMATAYRESAAPLTLGPVDAPYLCEFSERLLESIERGEEHAESVSHRRWFSLSDALRTISLYSNSDSNETQARPQ